MSFRKYTGSDKYHFRYYKKTVFHPFLVIVVVVVDKKKGQYLVSGFSLTSSEKAVNKKPGRYIKFDSNPSGDTEEKCYLCKTLIKSKKSYLFTRPLWTWHLSKEDEKKVDELLAKMQKENNL